MKMVLQIYLKLLIIVKLKTDKPNYYLGNENPHQHPKNAYHRAQLRYSKAGATLKSHAGRPIAPR